MTVLDRLKAFFTRRRSLRFVVAGVVLFAAGQLLDATNVLSGLAIVTRWVGDGLHAVQPFRVADAFFSAMEGHRGLWFCEPIGGLDSGSGKCGSVVGMANIAIASVRAIPAVTADIWREGGVIATMLFVLTLIGMAAAILGAWRDSNTPDGSAGTALLTTLGVLALGPVLGGVVFWLLLKLLLLLVLVVGDVLAGIAWCVVTFAGAYQLAMLAVGAVQTGDTLEETSGLIDAPEEPPRFA